MQRIVFGESGDREDRMKILLSHQPSSDKNDLTIPGRMAVIEKLLKTGDDTTLWENDTGFPQLGPQPSSSAAT